MKDKKTEKMAAFLAAVLMAALCLCQAAFAAESAGIEEARQSTLSIDLKGEAETATMALYRVGDWDGSQGMYVLTEEFKGAGVSFADMMREEGMHGDDIKAASEALIGFADANGIQPLETKTTEGGKLQFAPVDDGVYLVAQVGDTRAYQLVLTPLPVLEDGVRDYEVISYPKPDTGGTDPETPTQPGGDGNGGGSSGGRTRRSSDGTTTTIHAGETATDTIEDEAAPLADRILDTIEDALTPLAGLLPKTGDRSIAYLPLLLAFLASGAGIVLFAVKRRRAV